MRACIPDRIIAFPTDNVVNRLTVLVDDHAGPIRVSATAVRISG
jgi:hypothetical protein